MSTPAERYSSVAIFLHWLIAFAILVMVPLGLWMTHAIDAPDERGLAFSAYKLHKSVGLTVLALSLLRLAWRLAHRPPPMPPMPAWERAAAIATHWALYGLMIAMPLTGWLYISTNWSLQYDRAFDIPTLWFNILRVPELPFFTHLDDIGRRGAAIAILDWHRTLALGALALVGLHVAAALKHQFADKDDTFAHMAPAAKRAPILPALIALAAGALLLLAVALALQPRAHHVSAVTPPAAQQPAAPQPVPAPAPSAAPTSYPPASTAPQANAIAWRINPSASKITFSGTAPSGPFTGTFKSWRGDIRFSPDDLAHSRATITIDMADATVPDATGTAMLKQDDWFAAEKFPSATFSPASFKSRGGDKYVAEGPLKLRDKTVSITLPFTLAISGKTATMHATYDLDRIAFGVGVGTGETLVSKTIKVDITVVATAS
jgi:cytochrome b561